MSIDMYLTNSFSQSTSLHDRCLKHKQNYEDLSQTIESFCSMNFLLAGKTYDSARQYFATILLPMINAGKLLSELTNKKCQYLPTSFLENVFNGDLKESELRDDIDNCTFQINELEDMIIYERSREHPSYSYINALQISKNTWKKNKWELERLLQKLIAFNNKSLSIFEKVELLKNSLVNAINEVNKHVTFNSSTKSFDLNGLYRAESIALLTVLYEEKNFSQTEKQFRENLQKYSGFDVETAHIIVKIKKGIDDRFPDLPEKRKSYLFNLIISKTAYDSLAWDNTSGNLDSFFDKDELATLYNELGLSEAEYSKVTYMIKLQNSMAGTQAYSSEEFDNEQSDEFNAEFNSAKTAIGSNLTKEEFCSIWDTCRENYYNKVDFAHMSATFATLNNNTILRPSNIIGIINRRYFNPHKFVGELAGWRGDATAQAFAPPSLGNDDYKADLDADNISHIYKNSSEDYFSVFNKYYFDIERGALNRADEFVNNNGFEYIKNEILQASIYTKEAPSHAVIINKFDTYMKTIKPTIDELKDINPTGYNFIKSLENHENNLVDYITK